MNPDDLLSNLLTSGTNSLGLLDLFLTITFPFFLSLFIGIFYKIYCKNNTYSVNFILAIPLFSCLTAVITLLIGSNIARAFGLVGALSLIRFRTAMKDPLDATFLFWALAVGMACGTGFYIAASMIVFLCIFYMFILYKCKFGSGGRVQIVVRATMDDQISSENLKKFENECRLYFSDFSSINIVISENINRYLYSGRLKKRLGTKTMCEQLLKCKGIKDVEMVNQDSALYI